MKYILFLAGFTVFVACSPNASFTSEDNTKLRSLTDGETVEVVSNDILDDLPEDTNDDGINGNDGDKETDGGKGTKDDGLGGGKVGTGKDHEKEDGKGGISTRDEGKKMCRACIKGGKGLRMVPCEDKDKDENGELDEEVDGMTTTPKQIEDNKKLRDVVKCDDKGNKINVCHHPSDDVQKRKTLCVGASAIKGLVAGRELNYLGACPDDNAGEDVQEE